MDEKNVSSKGDMVGENAKAGMSSVCSKNCKDPKTLFHLYPLCLLFLFVKSQQVSEGQT